MVVIFSHLLQKERMAELTAERLHITRTHNVVVHSVISCVKSDEGLDV